MRQEPSAQSATPDPLNRGQFSDGKRNYTVRASSADVPDSFQVHAGDNQMDIVVVVSGLVSWNLRATWGDGWRSASAEWKSWFKDQAFIVFYNGRPPVAGNARVANA
ncbi:hypothetical protein [Glycomyces rhizosphaerae]|uniref:Uncharacterized protein n=1 Tax=Glycomyces rhizosphaerae TaxID=2054422 RepID=A0ABV7PUI8_9ACTN